jgi:histidinol-phosphatase
MSNGELDLALRLADLADRITMERFGATDLRVDEKSDHSPVTDADVRTEQALREVLQRERPEHGIVGEELGAERTSEWRWFLDPIDGTKNYARGIPVWGTLIALRHGEDPVCGVISAPALRRRWWARRGAGAESSHRGTLRVSTVGTLDNAHLSCTDVRDFARYGFAGGFERLSAACRYVRAFGDFWSHMLVAEGALDIGIEPVINPWDVAAVQIIVEEAGGRFSDFDGAARIDGGNAISSNGLLHEDVIGAMKIR